ncbi:MAG TPA: extracellular solute-binding protein [Terracidiphilus sp.]|nr:extracellular solute-binding protein [Terracidiphilus sp.]
MNQICLRGIAWNHSRALSPLVAAGQRFEEHHPDTRILWEKRSLDEFGHSDLATLADAYDLLIVDHPMMGDVHASGTLTDLNPLLSAAALEELESDALGNCLASYRYEECLYALPIDAAAPAASFRPDLLDHHNVQPAATWDEMLDIAHRGLVRMPGFPADLFLNFMSMCVSRGSAVAVGDSLFEPEIAVRCLEELRELASFMPDSIYSMNPIALYEEMASGEKFAYCPFAFSYSNYSRPGFSPHILLFAIPPMLRDRIPLQTVLGGTGIAVSAKCPHRDEAVAFSLFVASRTCQSGIYGFCGGQPASKTAWRDPLLNSVCNQFFFRTLIGIQTAYLRPRYSGFTAFQGMAGLPIGEHLRGAITAADALQQLDDLYHRNRVTAGSAAEGATS